ncbi:MAG: precorrin-6y C5,15-methyltransferase (decarboxylating) subunit CbiE [Clostridia bacterium]|jgi:cobalt-precorrin-7 (C5)-methyltransferase|nr:precorrin-6y C5,15-methyltransferase (decarboxylating) subunit CbiE [Clostridia bacterium]
MNSVRVVGLGPGEKAYILPAAIEAIQKADILIGAQRHLDAFSEYGKQTFCIAHRFEQMIGFIKEKANKQNIAVVVSGDTGFYSLLRYLKSNLPDQEFDVIPGISSITLMFARLGFMYDDAFTTSMHGKELDVARIVREYKKVGLLTDGKATPAAIAQKLESAGVKGKLMAIGERLSYADEKISKLTPEQAKKYEADLLSVVVIYDEDIRV